MKCRLLGFILFIFSTIQAQIVLTPDGRNAQTDRQLNDSILERGRSQRPADSLKIFNPGIGDYNFFTQNLPKSQIDTALNINSFYKQNVYRRDLFAYQQFPNWGQTLNPLIPTQSHGNLNLLPTGKSWMYIPQDEVKYYDVKTPLTEFVLENGVKEGQYLATTFSHNIHSRWNYAINYNYLKSQGNYLNSLSNNSSLIFSTHYNTPNRRYKIQSSFASHDFNNQENSGLTAESLNDFIQNNPNFNNRERMYVNSYYGQSKFDERRFHFAHKFGVFSFSKPIEIDSLEITTNSDSDDYPIYLKHELNYKHQAFEYNEWREDSYYASPVISDRRYNRKKYDVVENRVSLGYQWSNRLNLEAGILHQMLKLSYDSAYVLPRIHIPQDAKENRFGLQAKLLFDWRDDIQFNAKAQYTRGESFGNELFLQADAQIILWNDYLLRGGLKMESAYPNLHYYMNQSFYEDFNFYNPNFKNTSIQKLFAEISSHRLGLKLLASLINQSNRVYIGADFLPKQTDAAMNYFQMGAEKQFSFRNFGIDVKAQYQKVLQNADLMPIPDIIARSTIYYDLRAFKDHAHIQTGLTAHYFSAFNSREFFPILNEFYILQDDLQRKIGNYPQIDAFFNMKVDRMRIYLRGLNLNSIFQKGDYFSTPLQPARDFKIQIGIHWFLLS